MGEVALLDGIITANKNLALNSIIGAAFGGENSGLGPLAICESYLYVVAAGQRCMAISVGKYEIMPPM